MAAWPQTVPHVPLLDGWRIVEPHRPGLESEMSAGNIRARPTATLSIGVVELSIKMNVAQYTAFRTFVRDTIYRGTDRFTMPLYDGTACPTRTVRMREGGLYRVDHMGTNKLVSFSLDVEDL